MDAFFSHITALEIIRRWDSFRLMRSRTGLGAAPVPKALPSASEIATLISRASVLRGATLPLHVLVSRASSRNATKQVVAHLAFEQYPEGSFFSPAPGIVCSSPELVALQMAEYATDLELLLLVDELCGHYGIHPHAEKGLVKRQEPLTSIEKIAAFLNELGPARGARKLGRALAAARDRSGSPQESRSAHRIEFLPSQGGYGLKIVALNAPLEVKRADAALGKAVGRIRKPDILLLAPESGGEAPTRFRAVAIDYQGEYHRDPLQQSRDINRRNELLASDVKDYEIAKEHYDDVGYMDWLISRIRLDLGLAEPRLSERAAAAWQSKKEGLCKELRAADGLHWNGRRLPLVMAGAPDYEGESVPL